jgi:protein-tyrosine phosphatase
VQRTLVRLGLPFHIKSNQQPVTREAQLAISNNNPMIDLHCHILPDIDDGAPSLETSLAMAREAVTDGVTVVAATPHGPGSFVGDRYSVALVQERLAQLRAALEREQIPLQVVAGTELFFGADLVDALARERVLPYGATRTVLVELPYGGMPPTTEQFIFRLQVAGYQVVLAHPERDRVVQRRPEVLEPLVARGVLMQLTAEALTGGQGPDMRRTAEQLLQRGLIHLLASDAHGVAPRRPLRLAAARDAAARIIGRQAAQALVLDTPAAILANT